MSRLQRISCEVEFITPAFLGNATQQGQWRVPPFKALLRRWWRILKAKDYGYDWRQLREAEGLLWGNAFLEENRSGKIIKLHRRSLISLRFDHWKSEGLSAQEWERQIHLGKVAPRPNHKDQTIPVALYLGYGPVDQHTKVLDAAKEPALSPDASNRLTFIIRGSRDFDGKEAFKQLAELLPLIDRFGAVGSRSNNGWGSLVLRGHDDTRQVSLPLRDWTRCLELDWPHAIGEDENGALIWHTQKFGTWEKAMDRLAQVLSYMRAIAKKAKGPGITGVFLLGYPVQGPHAIRALPKGARWASQMRMKVQRTPDGQCRGIIYHLPHSPPTPIWDNLKLEQQRWVRTNQPVIWNAIHTWLDKNQTRWKEGRS